MATTLTQNSNGSYTLAAAGPSASSFSPSGGGIGPIQNVFASPKPAPTPATTYPISSQMISSPAPTPTVPQTPTYSPAATTLQASIQSSPYTAATATAAQPQNLDQYYTSQGMKLPSLQERQTVANQAGIANYVGTAQQNTDLLKYLTTSSATAAPVQAPQTYAQGKVESLGGVTSQGVNKGTLLSDYANTANQLSGEGAMKAQLQQSYKTADISQKITELDAEATRNKIAYELQVQAIRQNPNGAFGGSMNQDINKATDDYNFRQAGVEVNKAVTMGNLSRANSLIQQQLDMVYEPLRTQLTYLKDIYGMYQNDLSESEKVNLNAQIKAKETALAEQNDISKLTKEYELRANLARIEAGLKPSSSSSSSTTTITGANGQQIPISAVAKSHIDRINAGTESVEEAMKALPGVANSNIRNEISIALANQAGTLSTIQASKLQDSIALVDELLSANAVGKSGAIGFSLQKLVPYGESLGLQPNRTAFETKTQQLTGILTLDNLGLLKGPLSDADRNFIQTVSSGTALNMSEAAFDANLLKIREKLVAKQGTGTGVSTNQTSGTTSSGLKYNVTK